ncbi:U4/U6 x U5 tri-snRNP complex subunit Prp1 [Coemansia sp. RSA 1813]|nr:U4/U6 x U5 tri-snRNP complex subunit Prp1 [Coemansia sp. RSA 1843]KAJ2090698.1 U4/U6 x U5 tri-snRNP complex subunit Prp1 [Coemansia sp. RSA 986]KAJ2216097.1 U4/U6 x U5 tri-snRNP complex subunit Prp1 [Coemansia sp. RSA 487]KAJ2570084.1 U4/U6 x U5 tri-snRNP complex subunit Prp1 [Coemansia sp. RSA 1813]
MYPVTKDFLGKPAPPGYVAGLGRGATGFTTRSDIGPAREASKPEENKGVASKLPKSQTQEDAGADDERRFNNAENEEGLFSNMPYEEDDEEADKVWAHIDAKMEERHSKKPQKSSDENAPVIEEQLRGFKRQLQGMSADEWDAIPDVSQLAEMASRAKRRRKNTTNRRGERMYRVSDSTLVAGLGMAGVDQSIVSTEDPSAADGMVTNFMALGQARDDVLRMKLDQAGGDSASGKTTIDPRGYLTSLSTVAAKSAAEIGDISRARMLLKSVTKTNPKHAPGWIAAARLEEIANKMAKARLVIAEGCENCPQSEDIWLEAARLNNTKAQEARVILASAARNLPKSVRIWMAAADLERQASDQKAQKRILQRALEFVPTSIVLWKEAVSLEQPEDARVLLSHAVDLVPLSTDLWLALARLEPYERAQKVLNRARRAIPTSHEIWIAAARLEEQEGQRERVPKITAKAVSSLIANGALMGRASWFDQAKQCEDDGYPATCQAIVAATADLDFDQDDSPMDRVDIWTEEAEKMLASKNVVAARAVFAHALDTMPTNVDLWRLAADLEREHNEDPQALDALLRRGVQYCPQAEVLWLIAAKEKWVRSGDVDGARVVLEEAFAANPNSESILLAAVKLESENEQYTRALALLDRGRALSFDGGKKGTARIWMKSVVLLRQIGQLDRALETVRQGLQGSFEKSYKLWLLQSQIEVALGRPKEARQTLSKALKSCPTSVDLWIAAARLEASHHFSLHTRARAILERARVYVPRNPQLWLEAVCLECDIAGNNEPKVARTLLTRAIQECPKAGALWAQAILLEPRTQRKAKSVDALKNTSDCALIVMVARLFWSERRLEKARSWFERATRTDSDYGDAWAWWLRFEFDQGSSEHVGNVEQLCIKADPHHGQMWPTVSKDPSNARLPTKDILHKVAQALGSTRQL